MSKYGVTPKGVVIKRLDEIMDELHDDISEGWGVNTRLNPKSFLNVQLTSFGDKVAELWEFGEHIYHSMYPFSAEDISLDNAAQYGGISREDARPTFYPIHAECIDGTTIPIGTMIRTSTNPAINFLTKAEATVTRSAFNRANIRVAVVQAASIYTVALNGTLYSYTSAPVDTEQDILTNLAAAITDDDFLVTASGNLITVMSINPQKSHELVLSGNLTTASVTGLVNFASEFDGEIALPNGTINQIVTAVTGLISVENLIPYIAGRLTETNIEFRQSYVDKIFARSNRMIESIKSAILRNVQGVIAVAGYQNDTNIEDVHGRWPHCVEMVVDGGADYEIALQIWDKKTDGIQPFGSVEVVVPGDEGEPITMRFNRPEYVYVWFRIEIIRNPAEPLPPNYVEAIQDIVVKSMSSVEPGKTIVPQRLVDNKIYANISGVAFVMTTTCYTTNQHELPGTYATGIVPITPRQRAVTEDARVEVILDG